MLHPKSAAFVHSVNLSPEFSPMPWYCLFLLWITLSKAESYEIADILNGDCLLTILYDDVNGLRQISQLFEGGYLHNKM